jgi:RNA polymerase sigma-70 factor (family 1)
MNDKLLLRNLQQNIAEGNQEAYRRLFVYYHPKLTRFVTSFTRNRELSEEIVSDVFIKLWLKRAELMAIENLNLYIYVAAKNITYNYLDKLNRQPSGHLDEVEVDLADPFSNPEEALVTSELNKKLKQSVNSLPPKCKLIFQLIKEDGLSYKETARLLDISVSTVDNQLVIALKKLAASLSFSVSKKIEK